jgi:cytochrome c-type protein NapB
MIVLRWTIVAGDEAAESDSSTTKRPFFSTKRVALIGSNRQDRAFFTAPPPVRHFWHTERDSASCLQCHARKDRIEKRHQAIRPVPHAEYSQCMQCHVRGNRKDVKPFAEQNQFVGLARPGKGQRAHPKAPPTIPHRVFMRDNCISCHGPTGYAEFRTSHPNRTQCQQCHVAEER